MKIKVFSENGNRGLLRTGCLVFLSCLFVKSVVMGVWKNQGLTWREYAGSPVVIISDEAFL